MQIDSCVFDVPFTNRASYVHKNDLYDVFTDTMEQLRGGGHKGTGELIIYHTHSNIFRITCLFKNNVYQQGRSIVKPKHILKNNTM